jgi:hypothetical protein
MSGTLLDVVNAGSFWLLIVDTGSRIVEQAVEPRFMFDMATGEGLSLPGELVGREVALSEDGLVVEFV